ncbi:MAG: N-6 DNA methylase [Candidatus Euphemobacter frigidus]|nr:N-6 DNA methylase [Candidatus Euphemobacter frigidus]MDP8276804.1 N-6 DNA methylase [Candidatus Euphemobacter frigidus]
MKPPEKIKRLVDVFDRNLEAYKSSGYKEANVRFEFIDPFFEALGWDIYNKKGYAEAYKDVITEDAIKIGGVTKAPDYCFRIGGARKFFVEAKKPSVDIKGEVSPAYQLRRYAWSAGLPLSILTDFEEFAVYDCRVRPHLGDKSGNARVIYLTYKEYLDRWEEITSIFSKQAVMEGLFDKYVESKRKRTTQEVDVEFLKEIENWRTLLARNIALRNSSLGIQEVNFAVQRTIDRIIFLRICEDRGIESYGQLQALLNGTNVYERLQKIYRLADDKYNSGLFHFRQEKEIVTPPDELTLSIKIDDRVLKEIFKQLYYPESPYEFSVLGADILGNIYEQFLGKVITLTKGHHAKVEEKPEVRKAGGVYYTPTYIVDYIVKNTVGKLCEGKTPKKIEKLRILDPACGSGSFLIGAYTSLIDYHRDWYLNNLIPQLGHEGYISKTALRKYVPGKKPEMPIYQGKGGQWYLTTREKKRILLNNIYGVDIDSQAVEVTKLSLLLKVLENENQDSLERQMKLWRERALPDLGNNIKCGNSLIGPDFYEGEQLTLLDDEEQSRINVFDWNAEFPEIMEKGGFDAVIGNPPYDVLEKERGKTSWPHSVLSEYVRYNQDYKYALGGKTNLFRFFLVRSKTLMRMHARFGMIVPLALLADISCAKTRRYLLLGSSSFIADCFPQKDNASKRIFKDAKLSTVVITYMKEPKTDEKVARLLVRTYPWNRFNDPCRESMINYLDAAILNPSTFPIPMVDSVQWRLCLKLHKNKNIRRLGDVNDFKVNRGEINQTIYRRYIVADSRMARLLKGVEVGQYCIHVRLSQGKREWFDEKRFLQDNSPRMVTTSRRIATQRITGVDERLRIVATIVPEHTYFADSTNSISIYDDSAYRLEYILGLLNSQLFQWRFKLTSSNNNVGTNELNSMPFRMIDFAVAEDVMKHTKMVSLVEQMLSLNRQLAKAKTPDEKTRLERQIKATDKQIDQLVYELYGLTKKEVEIIEDFSR